MWYPMSQSFHAMSIVSTVQSWEGLAHENAAVTDDSLRPNEGADRMEGPSCPDWAVLYLREATWHGSKIPKQACGTEF